MAGSYISMAGAAMRIHNDCCKGRKGNGTEIHQYPHAKYTNVIRLNDTSPSIDQSFLNCMTVTPVLCRTCAASLRMELDLPGSCED